MLVTVVKHPQACPAMTGGHCDILVTIASTNVNGKLLYQLGPLLRLSVHSGAFRGHVTLTHLLKLAPYWLNLNQERKRHPNKAGVQDKHSRVARAILTVNQ